MGIDLPPEPDTKEHADSDLLRILLVGRLARVRRIELAIKAVARLNIPCRLTVVGGEEKTSSVSRKGYLTELKSLVQELGIGNHVHFEGRKNPEELHDYYKNADLFVYPSRYENFGQPVLEAAAHGLPLIASPVGVACDLIEEGHTGFFAPEDPSALAERINQFASSHDRKVMGKNLRERVQAQFSWNQVMEQYLNMYRSL